MQRIYFDRNVFSALSELEAGITNADVEKIKCAVESSAITILGSIPLFEETLTTIARSDDMYARHLTTVFDLIDKRNIVKPVRELILDDCYHYAVGKSGAGRTMPVTYQLREVFNLEKNRERLRDLADHIKRYRADMAGNITEGLLRARADGLRKQVGNPDDFDEVWEGLSHHGAIFWADQCTREIKRKCYKRGLQQMLKIKSVRLFTLYYLSLVHTGWFGVQGDPRKVRHGDIGDMFHAVSASAANIFVTMESRTRPGHLGHILSLKPTARFEVLNLSEFLQRL